MNYQKHYDNLILKSQNRCILKHVYTEKHHVIPKCMNGTNEKLNIIVLFPEEHIVAHLLLAKIYPYNEKIIFAAHCMINGLNKCSTKIKNNKQYKFVREQHAKIIGKILGACRRSLTTEQLKSRAAKSAETTKRLGLLKGKNHPLYGIGHSDEAKIKIAMNHADVSGANNGRSKKWQIISPDGTIYYIEGTLKQFCINHNISINILKRNVNKVINNIYRTTTKSINTVGWKLTDMS